MSILPICDVCRQPKDSTAHFSLYYQFVRGRKGSRYAGNIDLCDDCRRKAKHEGRDAAHKRQRIEFGKVER